MAERKPIESWLTDMDGVLIHEGTPIPGADAFIKRLRESGKPFLVLTNNSIYTPRDLQARLHRMGLDVPVENIWTSALATAKFLDDQRPGGTAYVIGEAGLTTALHDIGYILTDHEPDYVVLGETRTYSFEAMTKAVRLINGGARFICTNPDETGPSTEGPLPATGAVAALITKATGKQPYFAGKPNPLMMRTGLNAIGAHSEQRHDRRPDGHRRARRTGGGHADVPRADRPDLGRRHREVPVPAHQDGGLDRGPRRSGLTFRPVRPSDTYGPSARRSGCGAARAAREAPC